MYNEERQSVSSARPARTAGPTARVLRISPRRAWGQDAPAPTGPSESPKPRPLRCGGACLSALPFSRAEQSGVGVERQRSRGPALCGSEAAGPSRPTCSRAGGDVWRPAEARGPRTRRHHGLALRLWDAPFRLTADALPRRPAPPLYPGPAALTPARSRPPGDPARAAPLPPVLVCPPSPASTPCPHRCGRRRAAGRAGCCRARWAAGNAPARSAASGPGRSSGAAPSPASAACWRRSPVRAPGPARPPGANGWEAAGSAWRGRRRGRGFGPAPSAWSPRSSRPVGPPGGGLSAPGSAPKPL